ncbi:MAG: DMT family transporter [Bacillota bacterium]
MLNDNYKGSLFAIFSAAGFGTIPILALYAYEGGVSVFTLIFVRYSLTALFVFAFIFLNGIKINMTYKKLFSLFIFGGIIYSAQNFFYFSSLNYIAASLALLVFYTYPTIVAIFTAFFGKKLSKKAIISIFISTFGLILVYLNSIEEISLIGIAFAAGSSLFYAIYTLYGNHLLDDISLVETIAFASLFASISFFIIGSTTNNLYFNFEYKAWLPTISISIITMFSFLAYFKGIKLTNPVKVATLSMTEPIVGIFLSILLFSDSFNLNQGIGAFLVLYASYLAIREKSKSKVSP